MQSRPAGFFRHTKNSCFSTESAKQRPSCGRAPTIQYSPTTISAWKFVPSKSHRNVVGSGDFLPNSWRCACRSVQYNQRTWHHILNGEDTCAGNEAPSAVKLSVKSFNVSDLNGTWRVFMIPSDTSRTRTGNGCNVARAEGEI